MALFNGSALLGHIIFGVKFPKDNAAYRLKVVFNKPTQAENL